MPILQKNGRSVLFIHVPKAGGSAVEKAFTASGYAISPCTLDGSTEPGSVNSLRRCTPQHMHASMLRMNFKLHRFDAIFMVVREPVDRFRSEYLWRNRDLDPSVRAADVESWGLNRLRAYRRDSFIDDNHLRPQWQFFVRNAAVYRLEDGLDSAVADLNRRFALGVDPDVSRVRTARAAAGRSSLDVEVSNRLRNVLRRFYHRDYEQFGYGHVRVPWAIRLGSGRVATAARRAVSELRVP